MPLGGAQLFDAAFQSPGGIGRAAGTIGKHEAGGGVAADTLAVLFSPVAELADNLKFAGTGIGMSRGHDDQFNFGGHFKVEVGMLSAEGSEFLVAHGMNRQGRGKKRLIDQERQGLILAEIGMRDEVDSGLP